MSVRESFQGRHLLVTGFTGFLGKVWVAFLLDHLEEVGRLTLLVRGRRDETAVERVRQIFECSPALRPLREKHGDRLLDLVREKIEVVEADAREPLCGIHPAILASLAPRLDGVVHCAGLTDFAPDPIAAVEVNVIGAMHAADLAARTPEKRLIHVSTCFVAGEVDGDVPETLTVGESPNGTRFDVEHEIVALRSACETIDRQEGGPRKTAARRRRVELGTKRAQALGWPNLYTYSKGLAEHALAARTDLSLCLIRPSIVECARSYPFPGWNEGINTSGPIVWMCSGFAWKVPMRADNKFDVVPVDTCARGMTIAIADHLADRKATRGPTIVQLASGDHNPFTFDRALDLTALKVRRGYVPSGVSAVERALLTHMDSTATNHGADQSYLLGAAHKATSWLRDRMKSFDADRHLPSALENKAEIADRVHDARLKLNKTSMLLKSVEQLWKSYQPFIHDRDYRFSTQRVRARTAELDLDERKTFGWDLETMSWRTYWMDIEIPGLDKWSLPLLRGKDVPEDDPVDLGGDPPQLTARALPSNELSASEPAHADAEPFAK
ncbi:MAG: SDR family oxidoreductase [Sandaracinaceae bacterium]